MANHAPRGQLIASQDVAYTRNGLFLVTVHILNTFDDNRTYLGVIKLVS